MASARKTGSNEQVTTYDSAGGKDFTSLNTWEQATDTDHVTDTETDVLECFKGAHADGSVQLAGSTNNASFFRIIRPASGEGHNGIPLSDGTVVEFHSSSNFLLLDIQETFTQIQDLVGKTTDNSTSQLTVFRVFADEAAFIGCMAYDSTNIGTGATKGFDNRPGVGNNGYIIDCLSHNNDNAGMLARNGNTFFYNCTVTDNVTNGMQQSGGTAVRKNCITQGNGTNVLGTFTTTTSSDGESPSFVDSANDDFHLTSGDARANSGTDLSGDGAYAFDDDIDKETMSDWPIGFDEPAAAGIAVLRRRIQGR